MVGLTGPQRGYVWERRTLWALFILMSLALVSLIARPARTLIIQPFMEDTYYALAVARNLAQGNGFTIDGEQWTNGFQPLFTVVESLGFMVPTDTLTSLRSVLLLQVVLLILAALGLGLIVRDFIGSTTTAGKAAAVVAPTLFLGSLFTVNTALNGLETGPLMFGYIWTWWVFERFGAGSFKRAVVMGVLFGALVLTRIDAAVVVLALVLVVWRGYGGIRALTSVMVAALISAPWFAYNLLVFGSVMPSSGAAQTAVAMNAERVTQMLEALSVVLMPWLPLSALDKEWSIVIRITLVVIVALLLISSGVFRSLNGPQVPIARFGAAFLIGYMILAVYYSTTSFAIWFYGRYMAPLAIISAACLAVLLCRSFNRIWAVLTACIALAGVAACAGLWTTWVFPGNPMFTDQLALARSTVPEGQVVAAMQTGTLGFFREKVVNLDGKVNPQAIAARDELPELLARGKVNWLCDYPMFIDRILGDTADSWEQVSQRGDFACVRRVTPLR